MFLRPIKNLDKAIQDVVDSCAFWFMRRGLPKSFLNYALSAGFLFFCLVRAFVFNSIDNGWDVAWSVFLGLFAFSWILMLHWQKRIEENAEAKNMLVERDALGSQWWAKVWGVVFMLVPWISTETEVEKIIGTTQWIIYVLGIYLNATPRKPPPKEVRVPISVQLARAKG
jgi:hypothetical protein